MKKCLKSLLLLSALLTVCSSTLAKEPKYYQGNWESLKNYEVPEWYQDAKFGIWPIWGPYSVEEFRGDHAAEWYPRWMYLVEDPNKPFTDYENLGAAISKHHREKYGDPSQFGYHDFIPRFKAEKWDPDEWAQFGVDCGAKFFTVLSEFHDGFAMYDSSYTKWDSTEMGPKRDVTGEMAEAVRKKGMKFGVSNHFAHNRNFYSFYHNNGFGKEQQERPELADLYSNGKMDRAYIERWWNRTTELAGKYHPDLYYFDWGWNGDFWKDERPEFCSFFYNLAIRNGKGVFGSPDVVINYKNGATIAKGCAVLDMERAKMSTPQPYVWQTDTSVSDHSWGYSATDEYKSSKDLITLLADIVSKNGILMLAFGPKADGSIPDEYRLPMLDLGDWLKANGEAIYATRTWSIAEEGPTDSNNEHAGALYGAKDIRYTRSKDGSVVYATLFGLPGEKMPLRSTRINGDTSRGKVTMLANNKAIPFEMNARKQLVLNLEGISPANAGCKFAYSFKIEGLKIKGVTLGAMELSEAYLRDDADYNPLSGSFASSYPRLSGMTAAYEKAHNGVKRDKNYSGRGGLSIGGKAFSHGLMVCPAGGYNRGVFIVGTETLPNIKRFKACIGIEDSMTTQGNCAFRIDVCVDGKWSRIFESSVLTYKDAPVDVDVAIPVGTEFVRFVTTDGGNGCSADHAVWADATFVE